MPKNRITSFLKEYGSCILALLFATFVTLHISLTDTEASSRETPLDEREAQKTTEQEKLPASNNKTTAKKEAKPHAVVNPPAQAGDPVKGSTTTYTLHYIIPDHLGSPSIILDEEGNVEEVIDYKPYGEVNFKESSSSYESPYTFTGKERDEKSGLTYFGARYYGDTWGRFTTIDPVSRLVGSKNYFTDPQQWNNYSYVRNNPLTYIDPWGLETKVYIEKENAKQGLKSVMGHSFVEISRDGESTIYSWAPKHGSDLSKEEYGPELGVTTPESYFSYENKSQDEFTIYTFDTTEEQENDIKEFYRELGDKNLGLDPSNEMSFNTLSYNCTDVTIDAMKSGEIVSEDFSSNLLWSTPADLNRQLDNKYEYQDTKWYSPKRWLNLYDSIKSNQILMPITNKETLKTYENE